MREYVDIPEGRFEITGAQLRDLFTTGLTRGYSTEVWGFREQTVPEWRAFYRLEHFSEALGRSTESFADVLANGVSEFTRFCTPDTPTGLPADDAGWDAAAKLATEVFGTCVREDLSVHLKALLPSSNYRRFEVNGKTDVAEDETYFKLDADEPHGGSETEWLAVEGASLLAVLTGASERLDAMVAALKDKDKEIEERREAMIRHRAERAAQESA